MGHVTESHYVKTWGVLLVLFTISVCGPMLGIQIVTLLTAFGIAIVKAYIVAKEFMHLNIEKKYISYVLLTMVLMAILFVAGTAVDVMGPKGQNWVKDQVDLHSESIEQHHDSQH